MLLTPMIRDWAVKALQKAINHCLHQVLGQKDCQTKEITLLNNHAAWLKQVLIGDETWEIQFTKWIKPTNRFLFHQSRWWQRVVQLAIMRCHRYVLSHQLYIKVYLI